MNSLFNLTFSVFILILIASIVENFIQNDKISSYVKSAIYTSIIITIAAFISNIEFNNGNLTFFTSSEVDTDTLWESVCESSEDVLERHMMDLCSENNLKISEVDVELENDSENFEVRNIRVCGSDSTTARNLISAYYEIDLSNIYADTEGQFERNN